MLSICSQPVFVCSRPDGLSSSAFLPKRDLMQGAMCFPPSLQVVIEADQQEPQEGEAKQDKAAGAGLAAAKATVASWGQGHPLPRAASPAPPSSWERLQEGKRIQEQQQGISAAGAALANRPLNPLFQQAVGAMEHSQEPLARMKSNPGSPAAVPPTPPPTTCSPIAPRPPGTKPAFRRGSVDSAVGQRALPAPPSRSPQSEAQQQFMTSSPLIKVVSVAGSGGTAAAAALREPSPPPCRCPSPISRPQKPTSLMLPQLPSSMTTGSSPPVLYGGGGKGAPLSPSRSFKSFSTSAGVVETVLPAAAYKPAGPEGDASGRSPMASRKNSGKYAVVAGQGIGPMSPPPLTAAAPGGGSGILALSKARNVSFAKMDGCGSDEAEE